MNSPDPQFVAPPETGGNVLRGDVAIVGMGCLFAGSPDLDTYWHNIISKFDAVCDPPADEWDPKVFYDPESKSNDRVYCKRGGFIGPLANFRPLDFGVMPVTVDGGEPDQWLALRVAHEALADAGYKEPPAEHMRTEVILGKGTYVNRGNLTVGYHGLIIDYFLQALKNLHPEYTDTELREIKAELKAGLPPFSADTAPALIGNIIAGRISNRLDLMGPSFTVDAACASALLAIEIGVRDLLSHKCDLVLAGGANVNAPLPTLGLFCQLGALSRREQIRPFDKNADGTILGEGLGMIVLKRRQDAERDGDRIYALIKGVGLASDGRALHVMAPRVEGEELALRRAYEMAGVAPQTVGLIEAHGTATPVGDAVEVQALRRIFGERNGSLPSCALGSVKSMIGHTMPAAGIAGVIKAALALYHRVLPPTINCDEPNPALNLDKTPLYVNTETRPWIHGADTPRRAGVNSFGFGGVNAHAVLEEYPVEKPDARSHQLNWDTEVFIVEAASRKELIERSSRLYDFLTQAKEVTLKDLAFTLNTQLKGQGSRLALIATSRDDLAQKLVLALGRLADPKCRQVKDNAGIYFFERRLEGKLAFVFPGEGAQYPNMLLDLCLHFPEVRQCFDLVDRALAHTSRKILPSEFIFPRSILPEPDQSELKTALWQIDGAVEAVLIGNWAMSTLLSQLQICPDMVMGHSTGDYSAMVASDTIASDMIRLDEMIVEWNNDHRNLGANIPVPESVLVAIAADSATVTSIVEEIDGDIYLAMDNCPHQSVLVGNKAAAEQAIEQLRRRGIIYEILPFDRPYHTPMFQAYAEALGGAFFARLPVSAPKIQLYSCTTAARYPSGVEEIRKLFVDHWVRPVLFTDTVKRMYDDGARIFVEAGPRGNLTAFVSDILRNKPHLAMSANVARRSGIAQINHLVGILAAQGVGMRLDYLYARRDPRSVAWQDTKPANPATQRPEPMKLNLSLPALKLAPRARKAATAANGNGAGAPQNGKHSAPAHKTPSVPHEVWQNASVSPSASAPIAAADRATAKASTLVMEQYFKTMEAFLDAETQVMGAFLHRVQPSRTGLASAPPQREFPLLGNITSIVQGQELTAVRQLSLHDDLFLRDHALGAPVSVTDPELRPLIVLPLTLSMEILAEAAAALMPGQLLVGMRDIQAHHWIQVDDAPVNLQITARRIANSNSEVSVQVRNLAGKIGQTVPAPVIEGVMIFGANYAVPPNSSTITFENERTSSLSSVDLYDGRLMFHGPCFRGVASVDRSGGNGVGGQLRTLPPANLFRSLPNPQFVTDPVLLDAAGQLVGFWAAEYLQSGFVVFPYHLERLRIYGPNRPPGERFACNVNLQLKGANAIRSDIEIAGGDGTVWMQLEGWADRRFDPPRRFHQAWIAPREVTIGEPWQTPFAALRDKLPFECYRLESLFEPGASLWKELWASLVLSRQERQAFGELKGSERSQMQWLSERTVAKDAVRSFLRKHHRIELLPADIEIGQDEHGGTFARGPWTQQLDAVPALALAHEDGMPVALAADGGHGRRIGLGIESVRELPADFENSVLNAAERHLLNAMTQSTRAEWILRLHCARLATGRAVGRRVNLTIVAVNEHTGEVDVTEDSGQRVLVYTAREQTRVVAIAIYEKRTQ